MAWIESVVLEGQVVRLEPLEPGHAPGLLAAAEPDLFRFTPQAPEEWTLAGFEADVRKVNSLPDSVAFAVVHKPTGEVIGRTTFMEIRAGHRALEIGRTWIARAHQGTNVNPEMKYLMLRRAFEELSPGAVRVQLCTSPTNLHSQRAIAKLGAIREGVLRRNRGLRDIMVFSVIDEEWPAVKAGLESRIGWDG